MKEVDARGHPCPKPVMMTKKEIEAGFAHIVVLVDNESSAENVARFAQRSGYEAEITRQGDDFKVELKRVSDVQVADVSETVCTTSDGAYASAVAARRGASLFCPRSDVPPSPRDSTADAPFGVHTPRLMS